MPLGSLESCRGALIQWLWVKHGHSSCKARSDLIFLWCAASILSMGGVQALCFRPFQRQRAQGAPASDKFRALRPPCTCDCVPHFPSGAVAPTQKICERGRKEGEGNSTRYASEGWDAFRVLIFATRFMLLVKRQVVQEFHS